MNKKILITGCGGYLGSYLLPFLLKKGYDVEGHDINFFKDCNLFKINNFENLIKYKDSENYILSDIKNADIVIHLAGISNDPLNSLTAEKVYDPTRVYSLKLAKICKEHNKKFIFASSCSVYGASITKNLLNENSDTNPQTGYSLNKLQIEQDLESIASQNFFPICLRFATIFGVSPRMRFDIVINMLVGMGLTEKEIKLNSDGTAWRPNLYIEDACSAIESAIKYEKQSEDYKILILNVGRNDNNLRIIDIAEIIQKLIPNSKLKFLNEALQKSEDKIFFDRKIKKGKDNRTYKVSFDKLKQKFGNICNYTVEEGVKKMLFDLNRIDFNNKKFKYNGFYRLQYLESLFEKNLINDDLKWRNKI